MSGGGDPPPAPPVSPHPHPSSPAPGLTWTQQTSVTFDRLKLTNNRQQSAAAGATVEENQVASCSYQLCITYHRLSAHAQVCLHSMHRYQPVVHITSLSPRHPLAATFAFPQTVFTTVTAYQNQQVGGDKRCESTLYSCAQITKLKIASNPFAKGFRESTRHTPSVQLPQPPGPAMVHSLHSLLALPHPYALYPPFRHPLLQYPKHGILQSVHYL